MKKIKLNIYSVIAIVYLTGMTVWAGSSVGNYSTTCGEPYSWQLPFSMFTILLFPLLLGILSEQKSDG